MPHTFHCTLIESQTGSILCKNVKIANSFFTRFIGLLAHRELPADHGLWLQPSNGIHTFFMRFAIDVVALDRNGTVLKTAENVGPWRIVGVPLKTRSILELPAGHLATHPIAVGQSVQANLSLAPPAAPARQTRPFLITARPHVQAGFSFGLQSIETTR